MNRRTDIPRGSHPEPEPIIQDPEQRAFIEAQNGLLQYDQVLRLVEGAEAKFRLRPSTIMDLNRIAIQKLYPFAGNYRTGSVLIKNTSHVPPAAEHVARLIEEMCDYVNDKWNSSAIHLASYAMWRLNWIHPFFEGNGRTSRAVSYLVLCVKLGYKLPGTPAIPEQIVANRQPYYEALDRADAAWEKREIDVSAMETLLSSMLAAQLLSVVETATGQQ